MKVAFATLGCRVNFYESEAMAEKFIREGYEVVDFDTFADVLEKTQTRLNQANTELDKLVGVRTRKIQSQLSKVQKLEEKN